MQSMRMVGSKGASRTAEGARKLARAAVVYLPSLVKGFANRRLLDEVETYCEFIGYPRSGHSLVGALLNAHPEIAISHELPALRYFYLGFGRRQVFSLILDNARRSAAPGSLLGHYTYEVPNQWQGRVRRLRVIGDKEGYGASIRLSMSPKYRERLERQVTTPIRFIHVTRNPFDIISTRARRTTEFAGRDEAGIDDLFSVCDSVQRFKSSYPEDAIFDVRHARFVHEPAAHLKALCGFLGVDAPEDYLVDCTSIVYDSPHRSRHDGHFRWSPSLIDRVHRGIDRYPFLEGYSFDSE